MKSIQELARKAGLVEDDGRDYYSYVDVPHWWGNLEELTKFAELVRAESAQEIGALQAKIDRLMLEHCPDEMTPEQRANWAKHQRPAQMNQCDGCRVAAPLTSLGLHRMPDGGAMACTKDRYLPIGLDDQGCDRN